MNKEQIKQEVREKYQKFIKKDMEASIRCPSKFPKYIPSEIEYLYDLIASQQSAIDEVIKEIKDLPLDKETIYTNICYKNHAIQIIKDKLKEK